MADTTLRYYIPTSMYNISIDVGTNNNKFFNILHSIVP